MLKVLAVGFNKEELQPSENFIFAIHEPGVPTDMTNQEYYMKCKSMVTDADVLMVKNVERTLLEDEVVMLYSAYTTSTPIFGVGYNSSSPLLLVVNTNTFDSVDSVLDHLNVYYMNRIIG